MSVDYGVYIGPYAMCKVGTKSSVVFIKSCVNPDCHNHKYDIELTAAFCSSCGSPVGRVGHQVVEDTVDAYTLRDDIYGSLTCPMGDGYYEWAKENRTHIWLPNEHRMERNGNLVMQIDFALTPLAFDLHLTEITEFREQFKDELTLLRHSYGTDNMTVHWGIIQDYS